VNIGQGLKQPGENIAESVSSFCCQVRRVNAFRAGRTSAEWKQGISGLAGDGAARRYAGPLRDILSLRSSHEGPSLHCHDAGCDRCEYK
jgi:hypothetical protein